MLGLLGREKALHPEGRVSRSNYVISVITFINKILILTVNGRVTQLGYLKNHVFDGFWLGQKE